MKKLMYGLVAAGTLLFGVGCGGDDVCDDLADASRAVNDQTEACGTDTGMDEEDFDKGRCEDALEACSDSDKDRLRDVADCIRGLPDCRVGAEMEWVDQFSACFQRAEGLSAACAAAAGG
ncbi:hypothetical protein VZQ01_11370 [Myxococcus faecalis]|uniref:hypothetical protein n=1 Tax=Myxococcus TaxID=32 RepID=UPI001141DC90|nr:MULTISPECIES: hypothetical protein [Myxococcus]MCK8502495.1 hypothetical protein [Myxococcus fulvus]